MKGRVSLVLILGTIGCQEPAVLDDGIILLAPRDQLIRVSLDLRGVHPTEEELAHVEAYPDAYDDLVERYLVDPRFGDRVEEIFNYAFLTRTGETYFDPAEAGLGDLDPTRVADSVGDEPLRLIRHVVTRDLPYSDIVTADYVMADAIVAAMWDLEREASGDAWRRATYMDGRPHAGILSSTTLWSRYPSAGVNNNRHRANMLSTILLCDDYLSRPVSFARSQIDALTGGDPEDVIRENGVCMSCHSTLDPLASHFYGFWWEIDGALEEQTLYRPEDEELWRYGSGLSPAYYGTPTASLVELGEEIAADGRFVDCAVRTVFEGLTQRATSDADWTEVMGHRQVFADSGLVVRDLIRSIVTSRTYLAQSIVDPELDDRIPTVKTVTPQQLAELVFDKTGYRWTFGGRDGLTRNALGLGVLAGGIDGRFVTRPSYDPSVGAVLVQERLAQAAAWHVVTHDFDPNRSDAPILLEYVTEASRPDRDREAFAAQIADLYRTITGRPLQEPAGESAEATEAPEVAELIALWQQLLSVNASPRSAWAGVISVVLRDPQVLFY